MDLKVLKCGNCEELKLGVHALALGVAALCGAYNAAAWLSRRERHLAINTVLYAALVAFEQLRNGVHQRPSDSSHEKLPVRFAAHDTPRLTRVTAS